MVYAENQQEPLLRLPWVLSQRHESVCLETDEITLAYWHIGLARIDRMRGEAAIRELIDRETRAWDTQDVTLLLSIFHPDMVWPWPLTYTSVDPLDWRLVMGRFEPDRWRAVYEDLFNRYELVRNQRSTIRIEVSAEDDGALAIVDIDTQWRERSTGDMGNHWLGRTCKVYVRVADGWKMLTQTGALQYD